MPKSLQEILHLADELPDCVRSFCCCCVVVVGLCSFCCGGIRVVGVRRPRPELGR